MPAEAVVATLRETWQILTGLGIPSALVGGLALANWGRIRSTQDVDLLIAITRERSKSLLAELYAAGYRSKGKTPSVKLEDVEVMQLLYEPPEAFMYVQIDFLLAESPFHRQAIERRVKLPPTALGFELEVVSCEDLIVLKLLAGRILDQVDAAELLKLNRPSLDVEYLTGWVQKLNLQKPFREAWGEALPSETLPGVAGN